MRRIPLVLLLLFVASACGCGGREESRSVVPEEKSGGTAVASENFSGRLEAAKAIFDSNKRDAALAKVSLAAAEAGEGEVAKQAVQTMFSTNAKDDACYNAAVALAKVGKGKEAKAVADLMFSTNRKDEAMTKIASGGK